MDNPQSFPQIFNLVLFRSCDFFDARDEVPVLVQVSDYAFRRVPDRLRQHHHRQLRMQVVA